MASNSPDLWLCLYFPQLALEIYSRGLTPEEKQKPIVVLERGRVCRQNLAAKELGINPGNNMSTAYTLSEQVVSFERNKEKETATLAHMAQWAYQFTPNVSVKAPDCLLLDVSGCLKLFKGLGRLKKKISDGLEDLGYTPVMGVNKTPLAAVCYARSGTDETTYEGTLDHLPVSCLEVDEKIIESLHQMGVTHIRNLLDLPLGGLERRYGVYFTDYLARLTGNKPDPQKFISPRPHFHHEITFMADVSDLNALAFPINRLLGELESFLRSRQLGTNHLIWHLSHRSHPSHDPSRSFSIYLAHPESEQKIFLPLTQLKLDQVNDVEEVDSITLTVNNFSPAKTQSGDLFQGTRFQQKDGQVHYSKSQENTDRLLNMFHARLGDGACFGLSVANDHRPERAWRFVRMDQRRALTSLPQAIENPRPVFLLSTPRALNTVEGQPCLGGRLELLKGSERIDFGWWDGPSITEPLTRDYYVARQKSGSLFWIFKFNQQWYLHGIFS